MKKRVNFGGLILCTVAMCYLAGCMSTPAQQTGNENSVEQIYKPDWESLSKRNVAPEWFRDAKFGIYFHWGVYSVPAFGSEWYPRWMHFTNRPEYKHHIETYGEPSEFGYHDFVPQFRAEKFNAEKWAELFQKSGARFAGPVAEHHDGFSMWASKVNPWNVKDMGPKRDICGELARALRKRGIRFVTTFHHARNLQRHDQKGEPYPSGGYYPNSHYPPIEGWPPSSDDPKLRLLYGNIPEEQFLQNWIGKLKEVVDNYQPDLIWFDSWLDRIPEELQKEFCAYYFNKAAQWGKEVVVTYKQEDLPSDVGVLDLEKGRMNKLTDFTWLTDDTISKGSWCYTQDLTIKPTSLVLHVLIDIVSKNGQLLLNISPKADGTIPENQKEVILGVGKWLEVNGEAIYNTRSWITFGEGPTRLKKGGGFTYQHSGYLQYTAKDIRFTRSKDGKTIYAIVLGWPEIGRTVTIKSLANNEGPDEIQSVELLGHKGDLRWRRNWEGLKVQMPMKKPCEHAFALKISITE